MAELLEYKICPLHLACASGKLNVVKKLLDFESGTAKDIILKQDKHQDTTLHAAVHGGNPAVLKELTARLNGATVDPCDANGDTPLHLAVRKAALAAASDVLMDMVQVLIHAGADPNRENAHTETPLLLAFDNPPLLELLVRENLRRLDYSERLLVMFNHRKIVDIDKLWIVVLNIAVEFEHIALLQDILDYYEESHQIMATYKDSNALERAIRSNNFAVFQLLLHKVGIDFLLGDLVTRYMEIVMETTYNTSSLKMAVFLIALGASPFLPLQNGKTPVALLNEISGAQHFQWHSEQNDVIDLIERLRTAVLHFLISFDVDEAVGHPEEKNKFIAFFIDYFAKTLKNNILMHHDLTGDTALHAAVKIGNRYVLLLMLDCLDHPDECNVQNVEGETPMQVLLKQENNDSKKLMMELLLDRGADPRHLQLSEPVVMNDPTLLHKALEKLIAKMGTSVNLDLAADEEFREQIRVAGLHVACKAGNETMVRHLLESKEDKAGELAASHDPLTGETAAHAAVRGGSLSVLTTVLKSAGSAAAARSANVLGQTPLHFALAMGNVDMVKALEAAGAEHTTDETGAGNIHFAARSGSASTLEYLCWDVPYSERVQLVNKPTSKAGLTPLHFAAWNGKAEGLKWLLNHGASLSLETRDNVEQALPWQWAVMGVSPDASFHVLSRGHDQHNAKFFSGKDDPLAWHWVFQRIKDHHNEPHFKLLVGEMKTLEPGFLACITTFGDKKQITTVTRLLRQLDKYRVVKLVNDSRMLEWAARRAKSAEALKAIKPVIQLVVKIGQGCENQLKHAFSYAFYEGNDGKLFLEALTGYCRNSALGSIMIKEVVKWLPHWQGGSRIYHLSRADKKLFDNVEKLEDDVPVAYWLASVCATFDPLWPYELKKSDVVKLVKRVDEIAQDIVQGYPNEKGRHTGRTALHWAAILNEDKVAQALQAKGCRADVFDDYGKPPYWYAGNNNNKELLNLLKWDSYTESLKNDRNLLVDALNAVLVAAALIASISFTGILNPPLGFSYKPNLRNQTEVTNNDLEYVPIIIKGITAFWVCNSLSFSFAIISSLAAVIGLIPSLYEFNYTNLRHALVTAAVSLLISIFCILLAFTEGSYSDLPPVFKYRATSLCAGLIGVVLSIGLILWFRESLNYLLPMYPFSHSWYYRLTRNKDLYSVSWPKIDHGTPPRTRTGDAPWEDGLDELALAAQASSSAPWDDGLVEMDLAAYAAAPGSSSVHTVVIDRTEPELSTHAKCADTGPGTFI